MALADQNKRPWSRIVRRVLRKRTDYDGSAQVSSILGLRNISETSGTRAGPMPSPAVHLVTRPRPQIVVGRSSPQGALAPPNALLADGEPVKLPWMSFLIVFLSAAALTFVAVYVNALRSGTTLAVPRFVQAVLPGTGLGLRVQYEGEHLLVAWDSRSPTARSAVRGILRIDDGDQHRDVQLDAAEVAAGSVLYKPATDDVTFRLELRTDRGTARVESIRVLDSTKPAPSIPATQPQSNPRSAVPAGSEGPSAASDMPARSNTPLGRENSTAHLDRKAAPPARSEHSAGHFPRYVPPVSTPPSAPITGTNTPPSTPPDGKTLSAFKPARPLRQVMPDAMFFGTETLDKPTQVGVRVTIDTSGRVKSARIASGEPALRPDLARAALTAARQWLFEPAMLRGRPIESEHSIVFTFRPASQ